jgi:YgiT-type zinc finger domain-containing protein
MLMNRAQAKERCYFCGHGTLERQRVTVDLRRDDRLSVIKNVPLMELAIL